MDNYTSKRASNFLRAHDRRFYSAEDIELICTEGRLSSNLAPAVSEALERAAIKWCADAACEAEDFNKTQEHLSRLNKAAHEFSEALNGTIGEAWDAMFHASRHPELRHCAGLNVESPCEFAPGEIAIRVEDHEFGRALTTIRVSDLRQLLDAVGDLSRVGQFALRKPGKGRPKSLAIGGWIGRMLMLWEEELGKPFKAGHMKDGSVTTPAAAFCVEAFRLLDPDIPPQRIHSAMRESIKARNQFLRSQ